ncbi:MAG TPA: hypothetical protein VMW36_11000 [Patescibacteria group bacterium]|nr:hypothetical protein [Patescibacteria group bacterium]
MKTGFKFGLDPLEYSKLIAQHRRSILAAGGLEKADAMLEEGHKQYRKEIGTSAETTRFTAEQMTLLTRAGIKPMIGDVGLLSDSFVKLKKTTGLVPAELMGAFSEIMDDESTIANLRAHSSEDERRAIVAGTARRLAENVAMGMTTEQAKAAAKQLNKLAGKGPLERFKDAAKMQAMGGAMGISGGARAAEIMRKGRRATEDEKQELQKYLSKLSNTIETSAVGPTGYEFMVDALATKLDIRPMLVDLNTTLAKPVAATEDAQKTLGMQYDVIKEWLPKIQDIIAAITKNPVAQMGAGAIGTALDLVGGGANLLGGIKSLQAARLTAQTAAGAAPAVAGGAAMLGTAALWTGGGLAAGAVGYGIGTALDMGSEKLFGMAISEWISRVGEDDSKVAQMMNAPVSGKGRAPTPITAKGQEEAHTATLTTATGIERQLTKMDESSAFLKKLSENSEMQIELAQKQLFAMTMSEDEKKENTLRSRLRTGNPYAEGYGRLA